MSDILAQVGQAILDERSRREYAVVVNNPRRAYGIAGIHIPEGLEAYVAETTCTVGHEHGIPCLWVDFAFRLSDVGFRVVLQNDLAQVGMLIEESVRVLLAELQGQVKKT
jgi:hypothetical protein